MASAVFTQRGSSPAAPWGPSAAGPHNVRRRPLPPQSILGCFLAAPSRRRSARVGMKLICSCEDEVACGTLQNLCKALCDGMCSLTCT